VLAIAEDLRGLVTACRVQAPLLTLKRQGIVSEYVITDSDLTGLSPDFAFDVLWVQRAPAIRLAERIVERFAGSYLHDMDDLLFAEPSYVRAGEFPDRDSLRAVADSAAVFTAPSGRLVQLAEKHGAVSLSGKCMIVPNALEFPAQPPREPKRPRGILFTQSHRLALTESREAVLGAVRRFAAGAGLPVHYFGPPPDVLGAGVADLLGPVVACGYLDFWRYHAALAAWPSMIGVAPLETVGDPMTLDFVAAKSDVKMVEYAGFGHPAVYSDAPPYADTSLRAGALSTNTAAGWTQALEGILEKGWLRAADEQATVTAARSLEGVARDGWAPALREAALLEPRSASELLDRRLVGRSVPRLLRRFDATCGKRRPESEMTGRA